MWQPRQPFLYPVATCPLNASDSNSAEPVVYRGHERELSRRVHSVLVILRRASLPLHNRTTRRHQRAGGQWAMPGVKLTGNAARSRRRGIELPEGVVYRFDSVGVWTPNRK